MVWRCPSVRACVRPSIRGFWPLSEKVISQLISNLMYAFVRWVFRTDWFWVTLVPLWPSNGKKMTENGSKCWFSTIISDGIHPIQFKLVLYTCWVSVQNWLAFGPCWPNFGPLVAPKWLKLVVSERYLKRYTRNPIQTQCVHLLG